jgi:hypothetical protein
VTGGGGGGSIDAAFLGCGIGAIAARSAAHFRVSAFRKSHELALLKDALAAIRPADHVPPRLASA